MTHKNLTGKATGPTLHPIEEFSMTDREFFSFSELVQAEVGIKMPPAKKTMLTARLSKRLRTLDIADFKTYLDFLNSSEGKQQELHLMIDAVTTNKTDFFREPNHFEYLRQHVLPALTGKWGSRHDRRTVLWSAGCSTGEEVYTIAMVVREYMENIPSTTPFSVMGTDVSTQVLQKAMTGIYSHEDVEPVPMDLRKKYLLLSKDRRMNQVKIAPVIKENVRFQRLNFMSPEYMVPEPVDVIFCRNVLIYFDRATQEQVINRMCKHLKPGGYLFIGHSESTHGLNVPVRQVKSTIYIKPALFGVAGG